MLSNTENTIQPRPSEPPTATQTGEFAVPATTPIEPDANRGKTLNELLGTTVAASEDVQLDAALGLAPSGSGRKEPVLDAESKHPMDYWNSYQQARDAEASPSLVAEDTPEHTASLTTKERIYDMLLIPGAARKGAALAVLAALQIGTGVAGYKVTADILKAPVAGTGQAAPRVLSESSEQTIVLGQKASIATSEPSR